MKNTPAKPKQKVTKTKGYTVSPLVQWVFIGVVVAFFSLQAAQTLYFMIRQFPSNHNFSGFYWLVMYTLLMPLVFFVAAYWINPGRHSRRVRLFQGLFLGVTGVTLGQMLNQGLSQVLFLAKLPINSSFWQYLLYAGIPYGIALLVFVPFLLYLRRHKQL
jgi:hypothetical protein